MSGLLRRLAGQALGEPSPVRPRAPAVFAGHAVTPEGEEPDSPIPRVVPSAPGAQEREHAPSPGPRSLPPATELQRQVRAREGATLRSPAATSKHERSSSFESGAAMREPPPLLPPLDVEPVPVTARLAPSPSRADSRLAPAVRMSNVAERGVIRDSHDAEPNEVHVHIGRIEVTAVHEAPRKQEGAQRPAASRRLEDYLRPRGAR